MSTFQTAIARGSRASQPAAATVIVGTLYCVTDENNKIERSTGSAWESYSPVLSDANISFTDITTNNVSTSKHGFTPKLPNDATKYLDGTGAYTVPAGGGGGSSTTSSIVMMSEEHWDEVIPIPGPAGANGTNGASSQILIASLDLTNGNFDNGNSTPLTLVAAPGANKVIIPMSVVAYSNITVTKAANPLLRIRYAGDTTDLIGVSVSMQLNATGEWFRSATCEQVSAISFQLSGGGPDIRNTAIQWSLSANTSTGTGTGKIRLMYWIADLS